MIREISIGFVWIFAQDVVATLKDVQIHVSTYNKHKIVAPFH